MTSDLRLALRSLARSPGFTAVIVLTLALGIGANTAIFSFFRGILLRPLPYAEPERTVLVKTSSRDYREPMGVEIGLYAADYRELATQLESFAELATYTLDSAALTRRGSAELTVGAIVTRNYFSVPGARAVVGRTFSPADTGQGGGRLAVLAHRFWQGRLGGDPAISGQTLVLNQVPFTIVGVMPADFGYPREAQYWVTPEADVPETAIGLPPLDLKGRGGFVRTILGRLRAGVSLAQAEREWAERVQGLPNPNQAKRALHLVNLREESVGEVRPALALLLGCVGLVLLIACLNVANLMLSRATARRREIGIRLALGAGRWRIARQLLAESLVLALLGGVAGVILGGWGLHGLVLLAPDEIPRLAAVRLDGAVLGFAVGITLLTGLLCGVAPVWSAARPDIVGVVKAGGDRGGSEGTGPRRLRAGLVAGQVAVALVLLVAATLLLRSLGRMQAASWGFDPARVVSARVTFMDERYGSPAARHGFYRALLDKLAAVPGFEDVGAGFDRIGQSWVCLPFAPEGRVYATPGDWPQANHHFVSPDYLRTIGLRLLQGRGFTVRDDAAADPVAIVDAAIARRYFAEGQAVGKRIQLGGSRVEIVGVVSAVKSDGPAAEGHPDLYLPYPQVPAPLNSFFVHVRTRLDVATTGATIERLVREIDGRLPVSDLAAMADIVAGPGQARRFPLGLLGAFAGLALVLAGVGIYGVTAYGVMQRTREIGVRMALGAAAPAVVALVLREGFKPIWFGLAAGMAGGVATALAMRGLLFGVEPMDGPTFVLVLAAVAVPACLLPARRAVRIDPVTALRAE